MMVYRRLIKRYLVNRVELLKSYLSRRAGCLCRHAAGSWNVLGILAYTIIWNLWLATRRFYNILQGSVGLHDVLIKQTVSTEDNRGLTSDKRLRIKSAASAARGDITAIKECDNHLAACR
jgi:hypothetical protein